jgi:pimeloyl-ACP methyl ester carboxylesterase
MFILHGRSDPLVPVAAAVEHHRLAPQSELKIIDGDHFMVFRRPKVII